MTSTANQTAAQNRLTIVINVRFYNNLEEDKSFEKRFTHFYDYPANDILSGSNLDSAFEEIFEMSHTRHFQRIRSKLVIHEERTTHRTTCRTRNQYF